MLGSGVYDVSATSPHTSIVESGLRYVMERSVQARAANVQVPPELDLMDPQLAEQAIGHYAVVCAPCHGAPGSPSAPWMQLYPPAPDLTAAAAVEAWTDQELFWIIKHGIKDTGMVAVPPGHSDDDVWALTAVVRQLPRMTPARYQALRDDHRASPVGSGRTHTGH